ncbi:hypothetical protein ACI7RC_18160 [Brevibacillus sp. B_LB10_24]|uniref:hypothetical protein n=1 Tax=Brevibacillus sp. B_LB10_24 TaxID=3380645 RepID=UPI0038B80DD2
MNRKREPFPGRQQAELPAEGTALNPVESSWVFDANASVAPPDELDRAMQQGE